MKKLIIILAIIFGSVSAYANGNPPGNDGCSSKPSSATGHIHGKLSCPLCVTVTITSDPPKIDFEVPAGITTAITPETTKNDHLDFVVKACEPADGTTETINLTCDIKKKANGNETKNTTELTGQWYIDDKAPVEITTSGGNYTYPTSNPMKSTFDVKFVLTSVNANTQKFMRAELLWDVTVTAELANA